MEVLSRRPQDIKARSRAMEIQSVMKAGAPPAPRVPGAAASAGATAGVSATTYTASMPSDLQGLVQLRAKYTDQPEFRGAWVTRFDWTDPDPQAMRAKIIQVLEGAKESGFNAVVFQVRSDATAFYPSKLEPWSIRVGGKDPGFDPVKLAIDEAHARGLEFHAYINACPASEEKDGPKQPDHLMNRHCQPNSNPNWLVYQNGKPAAYAEYWWLNPNLPEVQTYIRGVVLDFVTRYDVDGIHFDRIRFPDRVISDDPWSKARMAGAGNPFKLSAQEWQCSNLTRMLTDIYGAVTAIKPKVKITAAVWGIYDNTKLPGYAHTSTGLQGFCQDSIGWINSGCMDAIIPMIYWPIGGAKPDYAELAAWFKDHISNGRHIYGGQKIFDYQEMLRQQVAGNLIGIQGTCPFTAKKIQDTPKLSAFYKTMIFPKQVPTAPMPWKTNPTKGTILVNVSDTKGVPLMDAWVRIPGRDNVWLSSADGFCAIIDAEPAQKQVLVVQKANGQPVKSEPFDVVPGKPVSVKVALP